MGLSGNQLAVINNYFKRLKFFIGLKITVVKFMYSKDETGYLPLTAQ